MRSLIWCFGIGMCPFFMLRISYAEIVLIMNVFMTNDCYADVCFKRQAKTFVADDILHIFFLFFRENKS